MVSEFHPPDSDSDLSDSPQSGTTLSVSEDGVALEGSPNLVSDLVSDPIPCSDSVLEFPNSGLSNISLADVEQIPQEDSQEAWDEERKGGETTDEDTNDDRKADTPTLLEPILNSPGVDEEGESPTDFLPMRLLSLEDIGVTDIGSQRRYNEDYFCIYRTLQKLDSPSGQTWHSQGLYVLCDGMGGHAGGEIASALAVNTLREYFVEHWLEAKTPEQRNQLPSEVSIREGVLLANQAIHDINQGNGRSGSGRMGTTLVLLLLQDLNAAIAHVGDSRAYYLSSRQGLNLMTLDHEVGQQEILRGVDPDIAYARPDAYQLTQALGPRDNRFVDPNIQFLDLHEDCALLLASDGLTDNGVLEAHWTTYLEPILSSHTTLEQSARDLIDLANQCNGHDNITALLIRVKVQADIEQLTR